MQRPCPGAVVTQRSQLRQLRFCTSITGNLTLSVEDGAVDSDFEIFHGLEEIIGENFVVFALLTILLILNAMETFSSSRTAEACKR